MDFSRAPPPGSPSIHKRTNAALTDRSNRVAKKSKLEDFAVAAAPIHTIASHATAQPSPAVEPTLPTSLPPPPVVEAVSCDGALDRSAHASAADVGIKHVGASLPASASSVDRPSCEASDNESELFDAAYAFTDAEVDAMIGPVNRITALCAITHYKPAFAKSVHAPLGATNPFATGAGEHHHDGAGPNLNTLELEAKGTGLALGWLQGCILGAALTRIACGGSTSRIRDACSLTYGPAFAKGLKAPLGSASPFAVGMASELHDGGAALDVLEREARAAGVEYGWVHGCALNAAVTRILRTALRRNRSALLSMSDSGSTPTPTLSFEHHRPPSPTPSGPAIIHDTKLALNPAPDSITDTDSDFDSASTYDGASIPSSATSSSTLPLNGKFIGVPNTGCEYLSEAEVEFALEGSDVDSDSDSEFDSE